MPEAFGVAVARQVERVSDDEMGWQRPPQLRRQGRGERAHAETVVRRDVRGDDRRSSGAGDDEHPRPGRRRHVGEGLGKIVQLLEGGRAVDPVLPEDRVVDLVLRGKRPGVRLGGLASLIGPAGLEDDDGLPARLDGGQESLRVLHPLDVQGDHLRVRVGGEEPDQVGLVHVDPVSHAHERREAEPFLGGPVDQRRPDGSALRRDGHGAFPRDERPGGAEAVVGIVHSLAVRPDDADAAPGGVLLQLFLKAGPVRPRFGETSRDDDGRPDLPLAELKDRLGDGEAPER